MNINIQAIEPAELNILVRLLREFAEWENLVEYCEADEARLHAAMFGANAIVEGLLAWSDDEPAGFALYYPSFSSFRGELGIHIEDIFVRDGYRGRGIGEALLRRIAAAAASRGFVRLDLQVREDNDQAVRFYNRLGAQNNADERHFKFSDKAFLALAGLGD